MTVFIRSNLVDIINITQQHQYQYHSNNYFSKIKYSAEEIQQHRFLILMMMMMMKMIEIKQCKCKITNKFFKINHQITS